MTSLMRVFGRHAAFFCTLLTVTSSSLAPVMAYASVLPKKEDTPKNSRDRILQLEAEIKKEQALIVNLREQNLVLTSKIDQEHKEASAAQIVASNSNDITSGEAPTLTWPATGEYLLYSKVIDSYQKRRAPDLERSTRLLLKGYPQSVYGDNALYLQARLLVTSGAYQQALDALDRLEKQFPEGDKRVSALYLKGEIFEHMKQNARAQEMFKLVARDYPGSPESLQLLDRQLAQGDVN